MSLSLSSNERTIWAEILILVLFRYEKSTFKTPSQIDELPYKYDLEPGNLVKKHF